MTVAPTSVRPTAISPLATKTTSETLDGSPVPEEEVRDENDHSWSSRNTSNSRSVHDNPERKNVGTSSQGWKVESSPPALTSNAPWTTTAQAIERPSPQRASLLPPLGGGAAGVTRSPTKTSKMMGEPHLLPPSSVEARKPLTMRSDALPSHTADNMLTRDNGNASLERIVGAYKDDFATGSFGAPADSRRSPSTDPTEPSSVRPNSSSALTPPRPAANAAKPDSSHAGSMASSTENHPARSTEERPPLDQRSTSSKPRAPSPNYIPRNPKDTSTSSSPKRRSKVTAPPRDGSIGSLRSSRSNTLPPSSQQQPDLQWIHRSDPDAQEQALFEQRLCEDAFGVAVRKINQNGKSNLRYVKCVPLDDSEEYTYETRSNKSVSNKSVGSLVRSLSRRNHQGRELSVDGSQPRGTGDDMSHRNLIANTLNNRKRALTWGKKKDVKLSLDRFVCVRKGKTTDRTSKNPSPASRLLSLITDDPDHTSLDIEAPTRLDRDKFARAFARFLGVPLETDANFTGAATVDFNTSNNVVSDLKSPKAGGTPKSTNSRKHFSAAHSAPDMDVPNNIIDEMKEHRKPPLKSPPVVLTAASDSVGKHLELAVDKSPSKYKVPAASLSMMASQNAFAMASDDVVKSEEQRKSQINSANGSLNVTSQQTSQHAITSEVTAGDFEDDKNNEMEEGSVVSSLTGAGFDQEIVEELHQALTELRSELEASRAEAARAVKVAEQAIQSAEKSNANDWNSTVTHKAAEAAAQAQKRSAEAIAKQRLAEERLAGERRSAEFWRKQAEAAEEEAGVMQTRAAAAEVQRAHMAEELESERRKRNAYASALKNRFASSEVHQREALESAMERNRALEIELDGTRRDLVSKHEEAKTLQDTLTDISSTAEAHPKSRKKLGFIGRKGVKSTANNKREGTSLLGNEEVSSSNPLRQLDVRESGTAAEGVNAESVLKLHAEASAVRQQFELLRRATADELRALPDAAAEWVGQASEELTSTQSENMRLREKLALESAARRKLLHEVQDLRGTVRVYCRPRPYFGPLSPKSYPSGRAGVVSLPSQETILLHRDCVTGSRDTSEHVRPMSFEFDRIFEPDTKQTEVYSEVEELVLSVLDGYNVCLMSYGQTGSGKTFTLLGDVKETTGAGAHEPCIDVSNPGIQLQAAQQLFTVAEHRNARYEDNFSLTIVEVHNERLCDLVIGTQIGEDRGQIVLEETSGSSRKGGSRNRSRANTDDDLSSFSQQGGSTACSKSGKPNKLEIRTNVEGDIVVQGLVSVPVESFDDVRQVWEQCLKHRASRLAEQGVDKAEYEAASHVIATLKVLSTNIATGITTVGKIQFADLAGADLVKLPRKPPSSSKSKTSSTDGMLSGVGNTNEWRFANKSLSTLSDVVNAQCQYSQNVPYRNSTVTHLLRDSLQADTKVLMVVCISSDPKDIQETACALRFASKMKRVHIGKATKHTVSNP